MQNTLSHYQRKLSKSEINALPLVKYHGPVVVVEHPEDCEQVLGRLPSDGVLGFDTETRPSFRKGRSYSPSLLQLAGPRAVYLFRLPRCSLAPALRAVLSDARVVKAGVAVRKDIEELQHLGSFGAGGFVDLGQAARQAGLRTHGLRTLAANLLGVKVSKQAQTTNWNRPALTDRQIRYAATDAWVSRELYLAMLRLGIAPGPSERIQTEAAR